MKKTIVVMSALIIGCATVKAQKVSFGIKAGAQQNTFTMRYENDGDWQRNNITGAGFHVGGLADISLADHISVQPAVLFNSKGTVYTSDAKIKMLAIDVPVNFLYKTGGFFLGLGPNLSYGISAKMSGESEDQDWYKKQPVGEGDEEKSMLKRFEIGANLTMGYQFKNNILISTNYTQGVGNISNIEESEFGKVRTRQIGISIGYMFGK
jgi:hypothetical protein